MNTVGCKELKFPNDSFNIYILYNLFSRSYIKCYLFVKCIGCFLKSKYVIVQGIGYGAMCKQTNFVATHG